MSNSYTKAAFCILMSPADVTTLSLAEKAVDILDTVSDDQDLKLSFDALGVGFHNVFPATGANDFGSFLELFDDPAHPRFGCSIDIEEPGTNGLCEVTFTGDQVEVEAIARLIFAACKSALPCAFEWAHGADRLRVGEFGGGCVVINAAGIEYHNSRDILDRAIIRENREPGEAVDGDARQIEQYRAMPDVNGMVSLAYGFATTEVTPTWASLFTDYPRGTMMPIPAGWTEMSCRNETAPSFGPCVGPMGEAAQIWIDYEQPAKREVPEAERFTFCRRDPVGELTVVYAGDDYDEALRYVAIEVLACDFAHRLAQQLDPAEWREMRIRNRTVEAGVCASHDFLDANMVMLAAWQATRTPAIVGNGDASALGRDLDHVNAAWRAANRAYLTASEEAARFDDWRVTGRDVASLAAEGHDLGPVPPSDSAGRVYDVGFIQADGNSWIVDVAITSERFDHLIDAEAHLWSVFASDERRGN